MTPISRSYMPLADTSPEYWPRTWQAALGSGTMLIPPTFLPHKCCPFYCAWHKRFNSAKFGPLLSFASFVISLCVLMTLPVHLFSSFCWIDNKKASSYFHFYTHLFTFLSYETSLKNKDITNQQIQDALRANNCTSVEFDEVKLTTNTATCLRYLNTHRKRYLMEVYPNALYL